MHDLQELLSVPTLSRFGRMQRLQEIGYFVAFFFGGVTGLLVIAVMSRITEWAI